MQTFPIDPVSRLPQGYLVKTPGVPLTARFDLTPFLTGGEWSYALETALRTEDIVKDETGITLTLNGGTRRRAYDVVLRLDVNGETMYPTGRVKVIAP